VLHPRFLASCDPKTACMIVPCPEIGLGAAAIRVLLSFGAGNCIALRT
jgi:hypothetical protein